jgi:hypothetical protein
MKKRLVLADDDAGIRHMPVHVVKSERYEVVLAGARPRAVTVGRPKLGTRSRFTAADARGMNALRYWNLSPFRHKECLN